MIHTAFFSCAESNAYIMIIYKSSHKSLGELVTHARKFYDEGKMAAKDGESCKQCKRWTKYRCIRCKVAICNLCSEPEMDESVDGWIGGKSVGYCFECETVRPVTESLIASRHSYEEVEEKEDAADEVHSEKER